LVLRIPSNQKYRETRFTRNLLLTSILMMKNTLIYYLLLLFLPSFASYGQFNTLGVATLTKTKSEESCSKITEIPEVSDSTLINRSVEANCTFSMPLRKVLVTSPKGTRIHPVNGMSAMHKGIDLRARFDSVFSIMDGVIQDVGYDQISGLWIRILHRREIVSTYAHLSRIEVRKDDFVRSGQYVGLSGHTGRTTGPHLHLQITTMSSSTILNL
jgi:murein DD-endopeptidase MepM/ murein hydrolase activator NlpD